MDLEKLGNGNIGKTNIFTETSPLSSANIGHLISNPIDDCQTSPLLSSSARDSGCYSSSAEEWFLMQPHLSMTTHPHNQQQTSRQASKRRKSSTHNDHSSLTSRTPTTEAFDKVIINVSGLRFETRASTLQRYPETLLGDKQRRAQYFDYMNNEYFFERHRSSFEAVLYFYQSGGRLTRPEHISAEIFLEEIKFFDLGRRLTIFVYLTFCLCMTTIEPTAIRLLRLDDDR
jgi:hypothetical protein